MANWILFKILGLDIEERVGLEEIKRAYRKLSIKYHPDKNNKDEKEKYTEIQKAINCAYDVLKDEEKRYQYEHYGLEGLEEDIDWSYLDTSYSLMDEYEEEQIMEDEEEEERNEEKEEEKMEEDEMKEEEKENKESEDEEIISHRARPNRKELKFLVKNSKIGEIWMKDEEIIKQKEGILIEYLEKIKKEKKKSFQHLIKTQEKIRNFYMEK